VALVRGVPTLGWLSSGSGNGVVTIPPSAHSNCLRFSVDGDGVWQYGCGGLAPLLTLRHSLLTHTVTLSALACALPECTPSSSVTLTFASDAAPPGTPVIVSGPPASTTSRFAALTLASTAHPRLFACALDGSAAVPCVSGEQWGPLTAGNHTMTVWSAALNGSVSADSVQYTWTVLQSGVAGVDLTHLSDGPHSVRVGAVDSAGNAEPLHTFNWSVATVPPGLSGSLLSPPLTNAANATVSWQCDAEAVVGPVACVVCWSVDGGAGGSGCANTSAAGGVTVTGVDSDGNCSGRCGQRVRQSRQRELACGQGAAHRLTVPGCARRRS
jgi:hypothetical protein